MTWQGECIFFNIPIRFSPSRIMTVEAISPRIPENNKFIPIAFPINPRIPPSKLKPINLPA